MLYLKNSTKYGECTKIGCSNGLVSFPEKFSSFFHFLIQFKITLPTDDVITTTTKTLQQNETFQSKVTKSIVVIYILYIYLMNSVPWC